MIFDPDRGPQLIGKPVSIRDVLRSHNDPLEARAAEKGFVIYVFHVFRDLDLLQSTRTGRRTGRESLLPELRKMDQIGHAEQEKGNPRVDAESLADEAGLQEEHKSEHQHGKEAF